MTDNVLVYELSGILRGAAQRLRRYKGVGFHVYFAWVVLHLDDDEELACLALTAADFEPDEGGTVWRYGPGLHPLSRITDMEVLGDRLVDRVDVHRPL